ncbi:two pore channel protein 1, partial [Tachysurus ichikawai]
MILNYAEIYKRGLTHSHWIPPHSVQWNRSLSHLGLCVYGSGTYDALNNMSNPTAPDSSCHGSLRQSWEMNYQEAAIYLQEGENNDKFYTHPRNPRALSAYLFVHNHLFYLMELLTGTLLMLLSMSEAPAVPSLRLDVY